MIKKYLDYQLYTRGLSIETITRYRKTLNSFELYLQTIWKSTNDPVEINLNDIYDFIACLRKRGLQASTCNTVLIWLKSFFKYLRIIQELNVLHSKRIHFVKQPDKDIWFFNKDQKRLILDKVNSWLGKREITQLRNKLLTYMLLNTWLRCSEIAKIKVKEIWENLQVIGKWKKRRTVYLKKELLDMIREYLSKRKRKESEYLFDATTEWHIRESSIRGIYRKLTKSLGFRIHAHKFRHTFATDLIHIPWANIYNVATLLWHKNINTTQIYIGLDDWECKKLQFSLNY